MSEKRPEEAIRFSVLNRILHLFVMAGFIGLAVTGFSLAFSSRPWAQAIAWLAGGAGGLRSFHRFFAAITYGCVILHLGWLVYFKAVLKGRLTGPDSLFPRIKDLRDFIAHGAYIFGKGRTPQFDRFSYWEKFDYWAILIGMNTMGLTGLILLFPHFFTSLFPGYFVNLAQVLHLYEAIMAVALKFVVHIVTTHLRPEVFPIDKSIFNGRRKRASSTGAVIFFLILAGGSHGGNSYAAGVELMPLTEQGRARLCLDCHRLPNINTNEGARDSQVFCLECHGKDSCARQTGVSLKVDMETFGSGRHRYQACITCHKDVAGSPHKSESGGVCKDCHYLHDDSAAGDPHLRVQCQACHRKSPFNQYDAERDLVILARKDDKGLPLALLDHGLSDVSDGEICARCHRSGNKVGAASSVLPGKGIFCIICHSAPLSIGHWSFGAAFLIFLGGLYGMFFLWFRGRIGHEETSAHRKISLAGEGLWQTVFSRRLPRLLSVFLFDVLLQRRLLKESVSRWFSHSLIYYGFLGKFALACLSLFSYGLLPQGRLSLALLDKNNWIAASLNDLFGTIILLGIMIALARRMITRPSHVLTEEQDSLALLIIGMVALSGFVVEGARVAVTGIPSYKAFYSFIGYPVAGLLRLFGVTWGDFYGYLWWIHALLWMSFFAWLPFGKIKHIIAAPLTLLVREAGEKQDMEGR